MEQILYSILSYLHIEILPVIEKLNSILYFRWKAQPNDYCNKVATDAVPEYARATVKPLLYPP